MKPGTADKLYLHTKPDMQVEIQWESPVGQVPKDCLEWEVEHKQTEADGRMTVVRFFQCEQTVIKSEELLKRHLLRGLGSCCHKSNNAMFLVHLIIIIIIKLLYNLPLVLRL